MAEAVDAVEMQEWFSGLEPGVRELWLRLASTDEPVPRELIDTLPHHRRPDNVRGWVIARTEGYWRHGPAGEPPQPTLSGGPFIMKKPLLEFLQRQ